MRKLWPVLPVLLLTAACAGAGAWAQRPGGYYLRLAAQHLVARDSFDERGSRVRKPGMGRLEDVGLWLYGEYGLRPGLTLVASVPYRSLSEKRRFSSGVGRERSAGPGDLALGLRWQLVERPVVAAVASGGSVPLGYTVDADTRLPLGTGRWTGDLRLQLGRSLSAPLSGYITGELGYRARRGPFSDQLLYAVEMGLSRARLTARANLSGVRTLGTCGAGGRTGLIGDQDMAFLTPAVVGHLTSQVEASLELVRVLSGCNAAAGTALAVGVALKR